MQSYEPVIGLEVHAQLKTKSKAFCKCTIKFGNDSNTNVCPVCLGMPGTLPVLNKNLVEFILKIGLFTNCSIRENSIFARKNYFYPDLPKGYQISQYEEPICENGFVEIDSDENSKKKIGITRIHMEEDAGKSIHDLDYDTLVDINRCGVPLIEIVSEPELHSSKEAYLYLQKIKQIVTYLGICDGNMEEGSLRCDANISVRKIGDKKLGTKTEIKNMNSFRNVERALEYEIKRQIESLQNGEKIIQQTLLWNANLNVALPMRSKEEAHDYRYFPDPDLVPVVVDKNWIDSIKSNLVEYPTNRRDRFILEYFLPKYDADILTSEKEIADYFEDVLKNLKTKSKESFKSASNWIMTEVLRVIADKKISIDIFSIPSKYIAELLNLIDEKILSGKLAKDVFEEMLISKKSPNQIVEEKSLKQISNTDEIEKIVDEIIFNPKNKSQVEKYKSGNEKVIAYFVGETMKASKGKANPQIVNEILKKKLIS